MKVIVDKLGTLSADLIKSGFIFYWGSESSLDNLHNLAWNYVEKLCVQFKDLFSHEKLLESRIWFEMKIVIIFHNFQS